MSAFNILEAVSVPSLEPIKEKNRNLTNFQDAMKALIMDMKADDIKVSTRGLDQSRLDMLNRIHDNLDNCVLQEELERDPLDKKLTEINLNLSKLIEIGEQLYENIRVDEELHENQRIKLDNNLITELDATIKDKGTATLAEFDNIWERWTELGQLENHYELDAKFKVLKLDVAQLMEKKNMVIEDCRTQYASMKQVYNDNIEKDEIDLILLIERVEAATDLVSEVYRQQAADFENTMDEKSRMFTEKNVNNMQFEWENMLEKEDNFNKIMMKNHQSYVEKLKFITRNEMECTRMINMRLEGEFLSLQRDIIKQKKEMLINAEIHDYNLQILEKRNYEQVTISNLQKRNVSRLLQQYQAVKKKSKSFAAELDLKEEKLADEVEKLRKSIPEWQAKLKDARSHNKLKFDKLWNMNFNEIVDLTSRIMKTDKLLCEMVLQNDWQPPNIDFHNINPPAYNVSTRFKRHGSQNFGKILKGPTQSKTHIAKNKNISDNNKNDNSSDNNDEDTNKDTKNDEEDKRIERQVMRNILQQISDRGGIFLESKLTQILESHSEKNKLLVRLDIILRALNIENETLLKNLTDFFLPYTWCPNCSTGLPDETIAKLLRMSHKPFAIDPEKLDSATETTSAKRCANHYLVTEETFVLSIINKFASQVLSIPKKGLKKTRSESVLEEETNLIKFDEKTIYDFFMKYLHYVKGEKLKYWKVLEHAFNHYCDILRKREQLFEETSNLEKQNEELAYFLQQFKQ